MKRKPLSRKSQPTSVPSPRNGLGPLPKADRNAELQRRSLGALKAFLPPDRFLFRDERVDDAGVDGSLELLIDSSYTDLRSQVQIKSTDSTRTNQDGTISISIRVSNLNYLLNGPSPLYLLYVVRSSEFRFLWASDERKRVSDNNPGWMNQKFVTLRFSRILTKETLEEIHERIRREAQFRRQITDILDAASNLENLIIRICPETLRITDPVEAKRILCRNGIAIVSAGYASEVKELIRLLSEEDLREPRVLLVLAHAEYTTGRYLNATASIKEASLRIEELSDDDQLFLQALGDACDYQTGKIDTSTLVERVTRSLKTTSSQFAIALKLNQLRHLLLNEGDIDRRGSMLTELQNLVEEIKTAKGYSAPFKLCARISLVEAEGYHLVFLTMRILSEARIKQSLARLRNLDSIVQTHPERLVRWQHDIDEILKDAVTQNHPLLLATALQVQVTIAVHYITNQYRLTPDGSGPSPASENLLTKALENIEASVRISSKAKNLEAELRARILIADIYELLGRHLEAQEIARDVLPKAKAMEYAALVWRAEAHLTGETLLARFKQLSEPKSEEDWAAINAHFTDQEIRQYAARLLELAELPAERLPIVERDCFSRRDISNEKFSWCRHLELIQDLEHERHPATHYAKDPTRYCKCLLFGHESRFGDADWNPVILAFKRAYCEGCADRTPYTPNPQPAVNDLV